MTNEQLFVLLQTQISELREVLHRCHQLMPEDAPKTIDRGWRLKPAHQGKLVFMLTEEMKEYYEEETEDYEALVPLQEAISELEFRAGCLVKIQEIKLQEQ